MEKKKREIVEMTEMSRIRRGSAWIVLAIMLAVLSCAKSTLDCDYLIRPYVKETGEGTVNRATDVIGYAFFADTAEWSVASYADALAGVVTSRVTGEKRDYDIKTVQNEDSTLSFRLQQKPVMIVVCDAARAEYAWRNTGIVDNLVSINVSVTFQPWMKDTTYLYGGWYMVNELKEE